MDSLLPRRPIVQLSSRRATSECPSRNLVDPVGSGRLDNKATTVAYKVATCNPFGKPCTQTGSESVEHVGELIDTAAGASPGLHYVGARWMDPKRQTVNGKRNKRVYEAGPVLPQLDWNPNLIVWPCSGSGPVGPTTSPRTVLPKNVLNSPSALAK